MNYYQYKYLGSTGPVGSDEDEDEAVNKPPNKRFISRSRLEIIAEISISMVNSFFSTTP